jgi:hypothetical protein
MYVISAIFMSCHASFYSSAEERGIILTAYHEILKFIPKLKTILPYQADANEEYYYNVLLAVSSAHTPCDTMTNVI